MAAGQGFKTFVTGEVLTAGDVNGYLMQGINVFASTAARDAAITVPAEGQFAFTKDTNGLWYYDGAAWVASGATGDIEGVTAGVGISGGGTSGTVTVTNSMATAIDAKGDLVPGTGADTFSRLAVGANNTVLTADSAQATGLKWATPAAPTDSFTLINTGGTALSGSSTTISSIGGYNTYFVMILVGSSTNSGATLQLRFNGDSGNNYVAQGMSHRYDSTHGSNIVGFGGSAQFLIATQGNDASHRFGGTVQLFGGNSTTAKPVFINGTGEASSGLAYTTTGIYKGTSAITSVTALTSSGTFDEGTIYVYGG
jgi:hypothetical protein